MEHGSGLIAVLLIVVGAVLVALGFPFSKRSVPLTHGAIQRFGWRLAVLLAGAFLVAIGASLIIAIYRVT